MTGQDTPEPVSADREALAAIVVRRAAQAAQMNPAWLAGLDLDALASLAYGLETLAAAWEGELMIRVTVPAGGPVSGQHRLEAMARAMAAEELPTWRPQQSGSEGGAP